MDWDLLSPEEQELRSLIWLEEMPDGAIVGHESDPERAAELRRIIEERERASDAEMERDMLREGYRELASQYRERPTVDGRMDSLPELRDDQA